SADFTGYWQRHIAAVSPIPRERLALDCIVPASPSLPCVAARASVPPVRPYAPARVVQADLASAHRASQAGFYRVFLAGFVPRLQLEISRIGWRAAERERDAVVKLEVGQKLFRKL